MAKMANVKVRRLELTTSAHATEDLVRVRQVLLNLVPRELRGDLEIEEVKYEGHYGNPIVRLRILAKGKKANEIFNYIISNLSEPDRNILKATLKNRVDEKGHLYLRISKQEALQGEITLYEGDDIVRIVATIDYPATIERIRKALEEATRSGSQRNS